MTPASWIAVGCFCLVVVLLGFEAISRPHKANQHADRWFRDDSDSAPMSKHR